MRVEQKQTKGAKSGMCTGINHQGTKTRRIEQEKTEGTEFKHGFTRMGPELRSGEH